MVDHDELIVNIFIILAIVVIIFSFMYFTYKFNTNKPLLIKCMDRCPDYISNTGQIFNNNCKVACIKAIQTNQTFDKISSVMETTNNFN